MKKKMVVFGSLTIGFMVAFFAAGPLAVAHAAESSDELSQFKSITYEIFGNTEIESCEYLYGLDNSSDYIYVDFSEQGYVIYHKDSAEMLEYSPTGDGPYCGIEERKYYAGPSNYYIKEEGGFVNVSNKANSVVSGSQAQSLAVQVNNLLSGDGNSFNDAPKIDDENLIPATPPGTATAGYIKNAQYFVSDPLHGFNRHGTCGSVAAQLLLQYNNYYNDRRIIAPEHLNGGWNNANGNNDLFDAGNYTSPRQNPYVCTDPTMMTSPVLGSNLDYYQYIIGNIEPSALECVDTVTEYTVDETKTTTTVTVTKIYPDGTSEPISTETRPYQEGDEDDPDPEHTHNGSYGSDVIDGLENILKARIPGNEFEIKHSKKSGAIDSAPIKAEIDAGRPLIIGMRESLGGMNHWVVGYGYQSYTYPEVHQNAGETYSDYVVHFGWRSQENNIWVNESWCNEYIALEVKHEHNLNIDTEKNIGNDKREIRCGECGFRTVDELYILNPEGNIITECRYDLTGQVTVPSRINGVTVTAIGASAFENQIGITNIVLPNTVTNIGNNAFANCESLTNISIPSSIVHIGQAAFTGCNNLNITISAYYPNYSAEGNILYNKDKTTLISACHVASVIKIPITVTCISPYAFDGNSKLTELHIEHTPNIGQFAFANCENLTKAYFYSYTVPTMDHGAFLNVDFTLYVPHSLQGTYQTSFMGYTNKIASISIKVSFMLDDAEWITLDTYFGANIDSSIPTPFKEGYIFAGWYDNASYTGTKYEKGGIWNSTEDLTLYAKWTPQEYYIYFAGYGSEDLADKLVVYDSAIGALPNLVRKGYTFEGWKDEYGTKYTKNTIWQKLYNVTLTSDWSANEYTITYYGNGGTASTNTQKAVYDTVIGFMANAERSGYTFSHWNTQADGNGQTFRAPFTYTANKNITLYAQYTENIYNVTFNKQNGSGGSDGVNATYNSAMPTGSNIIAPSRTGYTFKGYYANPNGAGKCYYDSTMASNGNWETVGDGTIYAKWEANQYNVKLNKQNGTGGSENVIATFNSSMPIGAEITSPTRTGYVFQGYYSQPNGSGTKYYNSNMSSANAWNIPNDSQLYANWAADTYTVILDKQGGSNGSDRVDAIYNSAMPSATPPTQTGYTFQGYYAQPNGNGKKYYHSDMSSANTWDISDNKTIYAYWKGNTYTVTFDKQGGYGGTTSVVATYGSPMPTYNITAPTRTGYTFKGYYDQRNGNGAKYYDGPNLSNVQNWNKTSNTTLYADWEENVYTISLSDSYAPSSTYMSITVRYNEIITTDYPAPGRFGYKLIGFYSNPSGTGTEYFTAEWQYDGYSWSYMLVSKNIRWRQENDGVIYAKWELLSMNYNVNYFNGVTGETIYTDTIHLTHGQTVTITAKDVSGYTFDQWLTDIHSATTEKSFQYKVQLIYSYVVQGPMLAMYPYKSPGYIIARYTHNECIAEGTMITLSDGRQVPVETLKGNERLLVWNLHTGKFDTAPILFIDKEVLKSYQIVNLAFSDGTRVKVIAEHGFWDYDLNRYVYLDKNAAQYVGHWFNKQTTDENGNMVSVRVQLTDVTITTEQTVAYSPVTYGHLCYYVNGMLSMPGGIGGLFNIFEVDAESLKYDTVAMERDIEQYGLFTYEEFAQILPVPQEVFEAFNAQYFKVAIGKGIVTEERLEQLVNRYAEQLDIGEEL